MAYIATKIFRLAQGNLFIQSAQAFDSEELVTLIRTVNAESDFLARGTDEFHMTVEDERRFIEDKQNNPKELFLIARLNGHLVGTLGFSSSPMVRYSHKGSFGISILKDYWGLGIGKKLIETMIEWADANGIIKTTLEVDTQNNRAIHLYKALGFKEEGFLRMDRCMENKEFRDSLVMARFNPYYSR